MLSKRQNSNLGNIKTFISLMGGLATNTSSLLMGGNANFNLLSFKGVGMLEFSFGKDGVSSKNGINYSSMNFYDATINYVSSIDVLDPISGNKTVPLEDVYRVDIFKVLERRNWNNYSRLFPEYEVR